MEIDEEERLSSGEIDSTDLAPSEPEPERPSGLFWRFFALLLDGSLGGIAIGLLLGLMIFSVAFGVSSFGGNLSQFLKMGEALESGHQLPGETPGKWLFQLILLLPSLTYVAYGALFECSALAATPGKLIMGLRVRTEELAPLSLSEAFSRNAYKNLPFLGLGLAGALALGGSLALALLCVFGSLCFSFVDPLYRFFSLERQTLHDRLSQTRVMMIPGVNRLPRAAAIFLLTVVVGILERGRGNYSQDERPSSIEFTTDVILPEEPLPEETLTPEETAAEPTLSPIPDEEIPEATPIESLPAIDDGLAVLSGARKSPSGKIPTTPIPEGFSGEIRIGKNTFAIQDVVAVLDDTRQQVVLNLYDQVLTGSERERLLQSFRATESDLATTIRFRFFFTSFGKTCRDGQLKRYVIDINAAKARVKSKEVFFSFERSGTQIISREKVQFECLREPGGFFSAILQGQTATLLRGQRIPIAWNAKIVQRLQ